jgi:uncharacterized protein YbjT (DUF2867 family)
VSRTILVTGATGKTGRRLVPMLLSRGVTVRVASRTPVPASRGTEPVRLDWAEPGTYEAARAGVDAMYVVIGDLSTPGDPAEQLAGMLDGSHVERVVLLSALGVEQAPPDDPLRRLELAVEATGIPGTMVRAGAFMQNFSEPHWTRLDERIRTRDEIALPGGDAPVSWVSTEDIAAVAAAALTEDGHEGKGYTVVGPEPLTARQVAEHISTAAGRPVAYVRSGRDEVRAGLVAAGASAPVADVFSRIYVHALTSGDFGIMTDDVRTVTGREPVTFARFAAGAADAWRR